MRRKENVVLITVDCLRADRLSFHGYAKETAPNLDRLASEGVVFTEAISNGSHTAISFPAILTSTYGSMYGGGEYLSEERKSIAEVMNREGYSTAAFHSNPHLSATFNYDMGFDTFYDSIKSNFSIFIFKIMRKLGVLAEGSRELRPLFSFVVLKLYPYIESRYRYTQGKLVPYERAETITRRAINWLRGRGNGFFLWIHYMDPHSPWIPQYTCFPKGSVSVEESIRLWWKMILDSSSLSKEELKKLIKLYDREVRYVDYAIGNFIHELRKMELYDNSLIIVTSDHGEEFKEHGRIGHYDLKPYEELIHVPLVIKFPNGLYGGTIANDLVSLLDLAPTIVDWLGIDKPKKWMGLSLLSILERREESKKEGVIIESRIKQGHNIVSYRSKRWKLIIDEERKERELYDLHKDPREAKNLSKTMLERVKEFEAEISKHLSKTIGSSIILPKLDYDKAIRDRLEALGYL